ncbi:hypothetical protein GCM10020367_22600 [Streptomyces sannanensis]|uniref:Integral membrane protein n=1 Tax=Streptomyces sannanensis TaxID=285536 RepID=A0ABP6SA23_9ACTN
MELEKRTGDEAEPQGCLVVAIRIPVRIVVLVLVVPVRMLWDAAVVCARAVRRTVLRNPLPWLLDHVVVPVARIAMWLLETAETAMVWLLKAVFHRPWAALWRHVLVPVPTWLWHRLLAPLFHGVAWLLRAIRSGIAAVGRALWVAAVWLVVNLLVAPSVWMWQSVLTPVGRGIAWLVRGAGAGIAAVAHRVWAGTVWLVMKGLVEPAVRFWRRALAPTGRGIVRLVRGICGGVAAAAVWLVVNLLVAPSVWAWRHILTPVGRGVAAAAGGVWAAVVWVVAHGLVSPFVRLWRRVLVPVGREVVAASGHAWRIAGYVSRAVGRGLKWLAWNLLGRPARWVYLGVLTPLGHWMRDAGRAAVAVVRTVRQSVRRVTAEVGRTVREALRTARETAREVRREAWRALVGGSAGARRAEPVEPVSRRTRTLGSTRTASGAAPVSEISLRKRG